MKNCVALLKTLSLTSLIILTGCAKFVFSPISGVTDGGSLTLPKKTIFSTETVAYGNKQVDFLLVLDDSNSMLPELRKLAERMGQFLTSLEDSNIDWQMCLTTTRGVASSQNPSVVRYGNVHNWSLYNPALGQPGYLLKKGTANLHSIFTATVDNLTIGGGASADERAIKATFDNFADINEHSCYRPGAAVSVIIISDEDERSVGNVASRVKPNDTATAYQPFEYGDYPVNLLTQAHRTFGADVRFTFSSIIVVPGDVQCEAEQDRDPSPSHPGYTYEEMSNLTDGGVGSICDADYSSNLNNFRNKIVNSLSTLSLQCAPEKETLKVKVEGLPTTAFKLEGKALKFSYPLVEGTKIDLQYDCQEDENTGKE